MNIIKMLFFTTMAVITIALTIILITTKNINDSRSPVPFKPSNRAFLEERVLPMTLAKKRVSRFLNQKGRNPRAADRCNKDSETCGGIWEGKNASCCNNKCMDLGYDANNCGSCKNKCASTEFCCAGECVNLSYDKRHCGSCNNRCMTTGAYCIFGQCNYA